MKQKIISLHQNFDQKSGYSHWLINRGFNKVQDILTRQQTVERFPDTVVVNDVRNKTLFLPYAEQNRCTHVKSSKAHLKKTLPSKVKADIVYTCSSP